jgi:ABC-type antimicrobial peptide transport system permease subunit
VDAPQRPEIFLPTRAINSMALLLRTGGNPDAAAKAAIAAVWAIDPDEPATNIRSLEEHIRRGTAQRRFETALFAAFAALALLLAAAGLYGVVSHSVAQRTRELGVRIALGAHPAAICWIVMRDALRMTTLGVVAGTMAGLGLSRLIRGLLFGVSASDPATFGASAAVLFITAALACWIPAARAARLSPHEALRD